MADMSVSSRETQAQLEDLRQEQESNLQNKLQKLRSDYKKRELEIQKSGEAAVNHIKANSAERVEQVREEAKINLQRENNVANKNYADLRHRVNQQGEALNNKARTAEERASNRIETARQNEARMLAKTNEELRDFVARQNELRSKHKHEAADDISKLRTKQNEQVARLKSQSSEKIRNLEKNEQLSLEAVKESGKQKYKDAKAEADLRVAQVHEEGEVKVIRDRDQKNRSLSDLQRKYQTEISEQKREGDRRLFEQQKIEQRRFESAREKAAHENEQLRADYAHSSQQVQVDGERDIHDRQVKFHDLKKHQIASNNAELGQVNENYKLKEVQTHKEYQDRQQAASVRARQNLIDQHATFKQKFNTNEESFKESLHNQKDIYLRELYKQKQRFDTKFSKELDRSHDPFYQLKTFNANLAENPTSYVLKAKVAPYDTSTLDIIVKDDKIILSAKRSYQENLKGEGGDNASTNSYQTYRQEFKLDIPVDGPRAFRKVDSNGSITVIAPKKGHDLKA